MLDMEVGIGTSSLGGTLEKKKKKKNYFQCSIINKKAILYPITMTQTKAWAQSSSISP